MASSSYELCKRGAEHSQTGQEGSKKKVHKSGKRKYVEPELIDTSSKFSLHQIFTHSTVSKYQLLLILIVKTCGNDSDLKSCGFF